MIDISQTICSIVVLILEVRLHSARCNTIERLSFAIGGLERSKWWRNFSRREEGTTIKVVLLARLWWWDDVSASSKKSSPKVFVSVFSFLDISWLLSKLCNEFWQSRVSCQERVYPWSILNYDRLVSLTAFVLDNNTHLTAHFTYTFMGRSINCKTLKNFASGRIRSSYFVMKKSTQFFHLKKITSRFWVVGYLSLKFHHHIQQVLRTKSFHITFLKIEPRTGCEWKCHDGDFYNSLRILSFAWFIWFSPLNWSRITVYYLPLYNYTDSKQLWKQLPCSLADKGR